MKKIILTSVFTLLFILMSPNGFAFSGNHDSLLFDGNSNGLFISSDACTPDTTNCIMVVYSLTGTATGTVMWYTMEDISTCGPKEMAKIWHCEKRKLKIGDRLVPGEKVETIPDGDVEIRVSYPKGTGTYFNTNNSVEGVARMDRVRYAPGTSYTPGCLKFLDRGKIWIKEGSEETGKKLNETKDKIIESVKSKIWPKGTEFSIEVSDNEDIIKVYEGSVEVELKKYDDTEMKNNTEEMKKLQEDYQSSKISMEEMIKRSKELGDKVQHGVNDFKVKVTVEAGYQVTAGGKLSEVVPISSDDVKWWSDENFGK